MSAQRVPEQGDLLLAGGEGGEFLGPIGQLTSGDYLILAESDSGVVSTYSLGTGETTALFRANLTEKENVDYGMISQEFVLGLPAVGPSLRFYDFVRQSWHGLDPSCHVLQYQLSPDGNWIGAICDEASQLEAAPSGHIVMDVISIQDAVGIHFDLPRSPAGRDLPFLAWLDDGVALVSGVWVEEELRTCAVEIGQAMMYCPPLGLEGMLSFDIDISPGTPLIPFVDFQFPPRAALVSRECFVIDGECPGVLELQIEQSMIVITTPDPEIIWWIEPLGPDPTTEIGLVDLGTAELTQLASLGGDYSSRAVCPDGSCMFIFQYDSEINWRLNLDGSLQVLPFRGDVILGSFRIP